LIGTGSASSAAFRAGGAVWSSPHSACSRVGLGDRRIVRHPSPAPVL